MIGSLPVHKLAPQSYRNALDGAIPYLGVCGTPKLICHLPEIETEVRQRISQSTGERTYASVLWIEPSIYDWEAELEQISKDLPASGRLAVIVSSLMWKLIMEKQFRKKTNLAKRNGGFKLLVLQIQNAGFQIEGAYAFNNLLSKGWNGMSLLAARLGRPDISDRYRHSAQLNFATPQKLINPSSISMVLAIKKD